MAAPGRPATHTAPIGRLGGGHARRSEASTSMLEQGAAGVALTGDLASAASATG